MITDDELSWIIRAVKLLDRRLDRAERQLRARASDRERLVLALRDAGATYIEIGRALGISHQRVAQLVEHGRHYVELHDLALDPPSCGQCRKLRARAAARRGERAIARAAADAEAALAHAAKLVAWRQRLALDAERAAAERRRRWGA